MRSTLDRHLLAAFASIILLVVLAGGVAGWFTWNPMAVSLLPVGLGFGGALTVRCGPPFWQITLMLAQLGCECFDWTLGAPASLTSLGSFVCATRATYRTAVTVETLFVMQP